MSSKQQSGKWWIVAGVGVLAGAGMVIGALALTTVALADVIQTPRSGPFGPGGPGFGDGAYERGQFLADELGISLETLQAAKDAAFEASVKAAVKSGDLTQQEADQILERHAEGVPFRRGMSRRGRGGAFSGEGVFAGFLADELGITEAELGTAVDAAHEAAMEALLQDGYLSEEQVERMEAAQALHEFVEPGGFAASALGMDVDEYVAAREDGARIPELLEQQGMDLETFHRNLVEARNEAIDDALEAGVISQAQAELLRETPAPGSCWGPGRGPGRRGGGTFNGDRGWGPGPFATAIG
jgi:hypothetical protein